MTLLRDTILRVGALPATRAYLGATLVWQAPQVAPPPPATGAAPTFVDTAYVVSEGTASTTFAVPTPTTGGRLQTGDLLLFDFAWGTLTAQALTITTPTATSTLVPPTNVTTTGSSTSFVQGAAFWHVVTATEAANQQPSWAFTLNTALEGQGAVTRWRGVDPADPVAATPGYALTTYPSGTATSYTSPAVSVDAAPATLVAGAITRSGTHTLTATPAGYTLASNTYSAGGRGRAIAYAPATATGASTTAASWKTSIGASGYAWQTALKAAPAAPTYPAAYPATY